MYFYEQNAGLAKGEHRPALNHLSCQLELPPVLFVTSPDRDATVSEHEQRIRQYLGYRQF